MDCLPFRATSTVVESFNIPGFVCTITASANARAALMFSSDALGRTIFFVTNGSIIFAVLLSHKTQTVPFWL
jgi:hypothetical protein